VQPDDTSQFYTYSKDLWSDTEEEEEAQTEEAGKPAGGEIGGCAAAAAPRGSGEPFDLELEVRRLNCTATTAATFGQQVCGYSSRAEYPEDGC
jgi:hypothetical protein